MNKEKQDWTNLDETFAEEKNEIDNRFERAIEERKQMFTNERKPAFQLEVVNERASIYLAKSDSNFAKFIRSEITDAKNDFYPTISDIYIAGLNCLKKLTNEKISELVKAQKNPKFS